MKSILCIPKELRVPRVDEIQVAFLLERKLDPSNDKNKIQIQKNSFKVFYYLR